MSTSDPHRPSLGELDLGALVDAGRSVDAGQSLADAIAGVPDADALTRLANEFLRETFAVTTQATVAAAHPLPGVPAVGAFTPPVGNAPLPIVAVPPAALDAGRVWDTAAHATGFYFIDEQRAPLPAAVGDLAPTTAPPLGLSSANDVFDAAAIRRDFPILREVVNGRPLIWLDNAATTQKPQAVIDRLTRFYTHENSNVHRAAHALAARSTDAYEEARDHARSFLNAGSTAEIVFVRGTTEGINLIAQSWGRRYIGAGDEIVLTWLEHHSNIVPWQLLAAERGARLRVVPIDDRGQVRLDEYQKLLGPRTRLVSLAHVSNALGTVTPVEEMVHLAHRHGARVVVDGAQAVSHMPVDVQALGCDFYVFSGHKVFGPTGIGVVRGTPEAWEETPPWQGGGNMIVDVTFEKTVYHPPPGRFEAGTGSIADAVGLGAALAYLERIGMPHVERHEQDLLRYGTEQLTRIPGLRLIGTAPEKAGVLSFVLDGFRSEDVGQALDREGIAVRAGHHCAQPALRRYGLETTVRPSLAVYNSRDDLDALTEAVWTLARGRQFSR